MDFPIYLRDPLMVSSYAATRSSNSSFDTRNPPQPLVTDYVISSCTTPTKEPVHHSISGDAFHQSPQIRHTKTEASLLLTSRPTTGFFIHSWFEISVSVGCSN
jgi:hypothetical protein